MGVSKNNGTTKSSILIGFSIINHPFWGKTLYFWKKHPIYLPSSRPGKLPGQYRAPFFCGSEGWQPQLKWQGFPVANGQQNYQPTISSEGFCWILLCFLFGWSNDPIKMQLGIKTSFHRFEMAYAEPHNYHKAHLCCNICRSRLPRQLLHREVVSISLSHHVTTRGPQIIYTSTTFAKMSLKNMWMHAYIFICMHVYIYICRCVHIMYQYITIYNIKTHILSWYPNGPNVSSLSKLCPQQISIILKQSCVCKWKWWKWYQYGVGI